MLKQIGTVVIVGLATLALAGTAAARGGRYVFDGGTPRQQTQVRAALGASAFNWNIVPATIVIHLWKGSETYATKGEVWIDTTLLNAGMFAWGPVQHEYAHQVDFFLLTDDLRAQLNTQLGGKVWSRDTTLAALHGPDHASLGAERFASTLAWAYWESGANSLKPASKKDESAAMAPAKFRTLIEQLLGVPNPLPTLVTVV